MGATHSARSIWQIEVEDLIGGTIIDGRRPMQEGYRRKETAERKGLIKGNI